MTKTPQQILGGNVNRLRREAGLRKTEFCLMADISRPLLDGVEGGRSNITIRTLERIAAALGLEAWELLYEDAATEEGTPRV